MAVEARHVGVLAPQILMSREMMNGLGENVNMHNSAPIGYGVAPMSGTTTAETLLQMYGSSITDSFPAKTPMKSESSLTCSIPVSRKRPREAISPLLPIPNVQIQNNTRRCGSFTFLGEDITLQIQQQQAEIDRCIAQHTEKLRMEVEERRKRYSRRIIAAVEETIMKKLRAKEEEIEKIGKLNWALEERVKSLCIENQIWRDLAQTNEATANALRSNLEQVLAQAQDEQRLRCGGLNNAAAALMDDAESCCGSNFDACAENLNQREAEDASCSYLNVTKNTRDLANYSNSNGDGNIRLCRNCGKGESCVLLLPCRHLCLCTVCCSTLNTCPVCKTSKTASVHVNLSS